MSGTAANAATIVPAKEFQWVQGERSISQYAKASGFKSEFCASCGSPVPNKVSDGEHYWIPAGLLDDSEDMVVVAHLFMGSEVHWQSTDNKLSKYDEMSDFNDLIKLLRG